MDLRSNSRSNLLIHDWPGLLSTPYVSSNNNYVFFDPYNVHSRGFVQILSDSLGSNEFEGFNIKFLRGFPVHHENLESTTQLWSKKTTEIRCVLT